MNNREKDLRMVTLVLYNLSPIQQGIQSAHAAIEYGVYERKWKDTKARFIDWAQDYKTMIVLNGGTSFTMEQYKEELDSLGVKYTCFHEPDLNGVTTAIAFIVDYMNEPHIVKYLKHTRLA